MEKFRKLLGRLKEPSTHAGLAVLFLLFGVPAGMSDVVQSVAAAAFAVLSIAMPEKAPA